MHMYSTGSNANAAARKLIAAYPGKLTLAAPQRAPGVTPFYYPSVARVKGIDLSAIEVEAIEAKAKLVDADEAEDTDATAPQPPKKAAAKKKAGRAAKPAAKKVSKPKGDRVTITQQALDMMKRKGGATSKELQDRFGWLPHTVRGFVSNENRLRNRGIETVREKGKPTAYVLK